MRYSQGNRGGTRHTWGLVNQVEVQRPIRTWTDVIGHRASDVEVIIHRDGRPDRLVRCAGCGTRVYESIILEEPHCYQCGRAWCEVTVQTEDHLYRMYGGTRFES